MWENSIKSKYVQNFMNNQNIMFGYTPPMEKLEKPKNDKQYILMNVNFFIYTPFYIGNIIYLARTLRALLSNKNGILQFCKKAILQ